MADPNTETDSSIFTSKAGSASPVHSRRNSVKNENAEITIKDFFDFMKIAYQVYEHLEQDEDNPTVKVDWDELRKLTVVTQLDQHEKDLIKKSVLSELRPGVSKSESSLERGVAAEKLMGNSLRRSSLDRCVNMREAWSEALLKSKLNDVIHEGILDSILPYVVGYKKASKTTSLHQPIIKLTPSMIVKDVKKPASFGVLVDEKASRDRLGRRKSSLVADKSASKQDEVEIHVCDEVKGLKKDFRCPQRLLVAKMGYFADVTAGQKLEDMDISVHCDIQIFDWLMRWVKRDTILVADWPLLDPTNVIPILVSASFLQMGPLLHDCLLYCHAHMDDIVKTSTNLACLSDSLLTRLAAMYTNSELEAVRDRKDKISSRLYCKLILSLAEPVPESLRGHYATLATLFKCNRCNKLLGRDIAENVPCQPVNMLIDQRGNVLSNHAKDASWNLNDYILWLHGELRSWRRVYWRLWGDCHFLKCLACDSYFPAYQMEWCCHHAAAPQYFTLDGRPPLPLGRYPCCGERAYRFELVTRNTGCQFREHLPDESGARDAAVISIYRRFHETIAMRPPQLMFPERLTRLVAREPGDESGRLPGKEVFWWEGIQLAPPRAPLGLLGKHYTGNTKFNPLACAGSAGALRGAGSATCAVSTASADCLAAPVGLIRLSTRTHTVNTVLQDQVTNPCLAAKKGPSPVTMSGGDIGQSSASSDEDDSSDTAPGSAGSEEDSPSRAPPPSPRLAASAARRRMRGGGGRQWVASLSARSNQDGQRRFEERALRQMKQALVKRGPVAAPCAGAKHRMPAGGSFVKLETEWREIHCPQPASRPRPTSYCARPPRKIYK